MRGNDLEDSDGGNPPDMFVRPDKPDSSLASPSKEGAEEPLTQQEERILA